MTRSSTQSAQRFPLTRILGTEASVWLLRELSRHGRQLSAPALVDRSGLAKASVWAALASLEQMGVVGAAGTGRTRLYSLRPDHLLRAALDALFEAEERRFNAALDAIRQAASVLAPDLIAVWLYGSVARGEDHARSDLDVLIIAREGRLVATLDRVRDALRPIGDTFGFMLSVFGLETGEIARLATEAGAWWSGSARDASVLFGPGPDELARRPRGAARRPAAA